MILLLPMAIFVYAALKNGAEGDVMAAAFWAGCFVFSVVALLMQEQPRKPTPKARPAEEYVPYYDDLGRPKRPIQSPRKVKK